MNGKFLLDTNIIIALFANDVAIKEHLAQAKEIFIPCIAIGELYFGARKSERATENLVLIDEFAANNVVLSCNTQTAWYYGEIKSALRQKGCPLPENDIWIAAITLQHDLTLVTRDRHFHEIENLKMITW